MLAATQSLPVHGSGRGVPFARCRQISMQSFSSDGVNIAYIDLAPTGEVRHQHRTVMLVHGFASSHMSQLGQHPVDQDADPCRLPRRRASTIAAMARARSFTIPAAYSSQIMAEDVRRLMDHLDIPRAGGDGLFDGRAHLGASGAGASGRLDALLLGGLGIHLGRGRGPAARHRRRDGGAVARCADRPMQRMFRAFAEQTKSDLKALAACIRGSRQTLTRRSRSGSISMPTLISVGTKDDVSGNGLGAGEAASRTRNPSTSRGATTTSLSATRATNRPSSTFSHVVRAFASHERHLEKAGVSANVIVDGFLRKSGFRRRLFRFS